MQKLHGQIAYDLIMIFEHESSVVYKLTNDGGGHTFRFTKCFELLPVVIRNTENHAFLSFRNPDFRIA